MRIKFNLAKPAYGRFTVEVVPGSEVQRLGQMRAELGDGGKALHGVGDEELSGLLDRLLRRAGLARPGSMAGFRRTVAGSKAALAPS